MKIIMKKIKIKNKKQKIFLSSLIIYKVLKMLKYRQKKIKIKIVYKIRINKKLENKKIFKTIMKKIKKMI